MKIFLAIVFVCCCACCVSAQTMLKPSIGVAACPSDNDSICKFNGSVTDFNPTGLHVGDTAYDFTLFDSAGNPTSLSQVLALGKPVLLIAGSYTCPLFRQKIPTINSVVTKYKQHISTYVIYTIEAHPIVDPSPYGGSIPYANQENADAGIQYRQPLTYGQRKAILHDMMQVETINAPILLDAPCNQWYMTYGPAPNNATLIDEQGIVRAKEPWFDGAGSSIMADIDKLLAVDTENAALDTGVVTFQLLGQDTIFAQPESTVSLGGLITNTTNSVAYVQLRRHNSTKMPAGWQSAMCTDVCLSSSVDTTFLRVEPHSSKPILVYFYVGNNAGVGRVHLYITNPFVPTDSIGVRFVCITATEAGVINTPTPNETSLCIPNPVINQWQIRTDIPYTSLKVFDMLGREVETLPAASEYSSTGLSAGMYRLELFSGSGAVLQTVSLIKQ